MTSFAYNYTAFADERTQEQVQADYEDVVARGIKLNIPKGKRQDWETPADVFDDLERTIGPFTMDAACEPEQYSAMKILARGGEICVPPDCVIPADYGENTRSRILKDGLKQAWNGRVWLNPPYGDGLPIWTAQAISEVENGNAELVCALVPARPGPKWWQENIMRDVRWVEGHNIGPEWIPAGWEVTAHHALHRVIFLPGRITFVGADSPAGFDSAVVIWKKHKRGGAV